MIVVDTLTEELVSKISLYNKYDIFSVMSDLLSDTEQAILQTMTMQMNEKKALLFLKQNEIDISRRTYYRAKRKIEATKWQRLMHIAEFFTEQHLQRIDRLELVENLMWY